MTQKKGEEDKSIIVKQCVENLVSPKKLAILYKCDSKSVRNWVKKRGFELPKKYKVQVPYVPQTKLPDIKVCL